MTSMPPRRRAASSMTLQPGSRKTAAPSAGRRATRRGLAIRPRREQVEGLQLDGRLDAVAITQVQPPGADVLEEAVPALGIDPEGGADETALTLALIDVVEPHGASPPPYRLFPRYQKRPLRPSQAVGSSGPSSAIASLWDTQSGTSTPVRSISSRATRRK